MEVVEARIVGVFSDLLSGVAVEFGEQVEAVPHKVSLRRSPDILADQATASVVPQRYRLAANREARQPALGRPRKRDRLGATGPRNDVSVLVCRVSTSVE